MSVQNLATVFGPNILRPKMEDPVTIMEGGDTRSVGKLPFIKILTVFLKSVLEFHCPKAGG